jgi:hypothetical protein
MTTKLVLCVWMHDGMHRHGSAGRQPEPRRGHPRHSRHRREGVPVRNSRPVGRADPTAGPAAAGSGGVVLSHLLRAVQQLLRPQSLVIRRRVAAPPDQVARDAPRRLAVEQQLHLHLVLAPLPRVRKLAFATIMRELILAAHFIVFVLHPF